VSHQFKPGDQALIVGARNYPSNIGKTCELIEFLGVEQVSTWRDPCDNLRVRNATGEPCWLVVGDGVFSGAKDSDGAALALPRHLMPLRGDFTPEQQKAKEAEPCL